MYLIMALLLIGAANAGNSIYSQYWEECEKIV
jgi:hypothetical protein